jgi:hypothetical protein
MRPVVEKGINDIFFSALMTHYSVMNTPYHGQLPSQASHSYTPNQNLSYHFQPPQKAQIHLKLPCHTHQTMRQITSSSSNTANSLPKLSIHHTLKCHLKISQPNSLNAASSLLKLTASHTH